ncbi:MAG TPA: LysE family transporter [Puia sp.]|nr:LysE family transporter [Puia sp.]
MFISVSQQFIYIARTMQLLRIFFVGMMISFLGTLPLGTLNVAAMQISVSDGITQAIYFSTGTLLIEMLYVRISLVAMDWVRKRKNLFRLLEWLSVLIVCALAVTSFIAASKPLGGKNVILSSTLPKFLLGITMSALNPVQIPFWFGWSTVLFTKKILMPVNSNYNFYIAGIGTGTFIGNAVFIFGGRFVVDKLNNNQRTLNWVIGGIFAITAIIMLWKILKNKNAMAKI